MAEPREKIDIKEFASRSTWSKAPKTFGEWASLSIARIVLYIFAIVYMGAFVLAFVIIWRQSLTFEQASELIKYLLGSIIPIVTLAVGYYLGHKSHGK